MRSDDILAAIGNTPLVGLPAMSPRPEVRLWAKLEGQNPTGSMKDRIALRMITEAEASGELTPDRVVLEPTSGNTGISLAMICKRKGYRLVCVMPANVSTERRQLLEMYGVEMVFSEATKGSNGAIALAKEMVAADSKYFMPYQYGNEANPAAHYHGTAVEIIADLPEVDAFVAGLGTGGTLMGCGRRIKEHNPAAKIVAAEPEYGELVYGLRNLDEGFIPPIIDLKVLDRKIKVGTRQALAATRDLLEKEGIFAGISSGAAIAVAQRFARDSDARNIVVLLPDGGWKYLSTGAYSGDFEEAVARLEGILWA
ncbi:MAG: cysteine synthase [Actinobacteria bacterium]|nr:MAG: cysteine synthase [Actinomycetota bacterium]